MVVNIFQMRKQTLKNAAFPRSHNKAQSRVQIQSPLLYFSVKGARNVSGKMPVKENREEAGKGLENHQTVMQV